jgi:hypothetical protein
MKIIPAQYVFNSDAKDGDTLSSYLNDEFIIKNEPMLFNCDVPSARRLGGPITNEFLDKLDWPDAIIDSRVHMLFPNFWPCIGGWHCDDVERTRSDGQPNYENMTYHAEHCMALVGAEIAPTEFALGKITVRYIPIGKKVYKEWHPIIQDHIQLGVAKSRFISNGVLTYFNWETFHRGTPAVKSGWRFFIRASRNTARKASNELRKQVQVYLPLEEEGW